MKTEDAGDYGGTCDTCAHDRTGGHRPADAPPSLPHCVSPKSVEPGFWEDDAMVACPGWVERPREYGGGAD